MLWRNVHQHTSRHKEQVEQEIMKLARLAVQGRKSKDITYSTISFWGRQQQKISSRSATIVTRRFIVVNWTFVNFKNNGGRQKMEKYKIIFDGEEQDEVFDTEEAAEEYALYLCSCTREGAEILHMSNPGDYDYDEDNFEDPDYEIVEFDED